jgi:hypothetical protein
LIAGYLLGLVPGAVMSVVGGLGLITFGRCLVSDSSRSLRAAAALAIVAGALGISALRWGTVSLQGIASAQSVLGPSIVVGPLAAAAAAGVALGAGVLALGVWSAAPEAPASRGERRWGWFEVALGVLALAWVFAAPGTGGSLSSVTKEPLEWLIPAAATAVGTALALVVGRTAHGRAAWIVLVITGLAVVGSAAATTAI